MPKSKQLSFPVLSSQLAHYYPSLLSDRVATNQKVT